ncbi:MAG TPA: aminotransferase class V-fold PLP-dependent enzyme [Terriglobia bacterium]|nr:aminotransferase class V-fold PLP-dependent enzyme [Terriglobia bacterium]
MDSGTRQQTEPRYTSVDMSAEEFRTVGHRLVDEIATFLQSIPGRPVTPVVSPERLQAMLRELGLDGMPEHGTPAAQLFRETTDLIFENSLLSAHPRFWGYINASGTPIGALADFLAAAVNPNTGGWILAPIASEIERQTVRWIAELIGYPPDTGGLLVSGGNMANFVPFLVARRAKADWLLGSAGVRAGRQLRVYGSSETHTWIHKAADLFGLGTDSIRWIPAGNDLRMNTDELRLQIERDKGNGDLPFLVVGQAGSVSTGAIDPLREIAAICRQYDLWFHVDGAYGAVAAALPDASDDLRALSEADSVAVDPHKWLYAPLEAGCALVRNQNLLLETFSHRPPYYHFHAGADQSINYFEYGMQNSRSFRALKVWLGLRQAGRDGYRRMFSGNIEVAKTLYRAAEAHPELESFTLSLSISTFRYLPPDLRDRRDSAPVSDYLNKLNIELLNRIQRGGEAFLTNAVIRERFVLRACVVNFHSTPADAEAVAEIVVRVGREVDGELRPADLRSSAGH